MDESEELRDKSKELRDERDELRDERDERDESEKPRDKSREMRDIKSGIRKPGFYFFCKQQWLCSLLQGARIVARACRQWGLHFLHSDRRDCLLPLLVLVFPAYC